MHALIQLDDFLIRCACHYVHTFVHDIYDANIFHCMSWFICHFDTSLDYLITFSLKKKPHISQKQSVCVRAFRSIGYRYCLISFPSALNGPKKHFLSNSSVEPHERYSLQHLTPDINQHCYKIYPYRCALFYLHHVDMRNRVVDLFTQLYWSYISFSLSKGYTHVISTNCIEYMIACFHKTYSNWNKPNKYLINTETQKECRQNLPPLYRLNDLKKKNIIDFSA